MATNTAPLEHDDVPGGFGSSPAIFQMSDDVVMDIGPVQPPLYTPHLDVFNNMNEAQHRFFGNPADLEIVAGSEESVNNYLEFGGDEAAGIWRVFNAYGWIVWARDTQTDEAQSSPNPFLPLGPGPISIGGGTTGHNVEVMSATGAIGNTPAEWTFPSPPEVGGEDEWHSSVSVGELDPSDSTRTSTAGYEIVIQNSRSGDPPVPNHGAIYAFDGDNSDGVNDGVDVNNGGMTVGEHVAPIGPIDAPGWYDQQGVEGIDWDVLWVMRVDPDWSVGSLSTPAIGNIDATGSNEVVFGHASGAIYCLNGLDGTLKWKIDHEAPNQSAPVQSSPALADFDGDGDLEVVIGSGDGYVYFIDGDEDGSGVLDDFEYTRVHFIPPTGSPDMPIWSSPAIGNALQPQQQPEGAVGDPPLSKDTLLDVYIGAGHARWPVDPNEIGYLLHLKYRPGPNLAWLDGAVMMPGPVVASPALASPSFADSSIAGPDEVPWQMFRNGSDRNGLYLPADEYESTESRRLNVYVADDSGHLTVVDGSFNRVVDQIFLGGPIRSSPAVGDIDRDGKLEILVYDRGRSAGFPPDTFWAIDETLPPESEEPEDPEAPEDPFWVAWQQAECDENVELAAPDNLAHLRVPGNSVARPCPPDSEIYYGIFSSTSSSKPLPSGYRMIGRTHDFSPDGLPFKSESPATLTFNYEGDPEFIDVFRYSPNADSWEKITTGRTIDRANKTISVNVWHFSTYSVLSSSSVATGLNVWGTAGISILIVALGSLILAVAGLRRSGRLTRH